MYIAVTVIHIIACLFLIGVVLLQQGKGADMGAVFGGSSQTVFGSSGAGNFLTRLTTATAVIFMLTSLTLAYTSARSTTATVFDDAPLPIPAEAPAGAAVESAPAVNGEAAPAAAPQPEAAAPAAAPQAAAVAEGGVQMQPATGGVQMGGDAPPSGAAAQEAPKAEAAAAPAAEAPAAPAAPAAGQ